MRAGVIAWIVVLIAGPSLIVEDYQYDPDWLIVLVDRSASLGVADVADGGAEPITRDEQARRIMTAGAPLLEEHDARPQRDVKWFGFDQGIYRVDHADLPDAGGQGTALRTAIDQTLRRAAGHPISAILLMTDGRSPQSTGDDLVRRLARQSAAVYPMPLGPAEASPDVSIAQVEAPDKAFVNDTIPVTVHVQREPADFEIDVAHLNVRLVDPATGRVLDERRPTSGDLSKPVRLTTESQVVGPVKWRVEVEYDGEELVRTNNRRELSIELIDRPLRVLYIDGYPRWEYRYLKNMLLREKSVESSVLLLSADRRFAQEGEIALTRMPDTREEMEPFDVIIIGDVPASYFTTEQLTLVRDQVAGHGAGLLWVGGAHHTPRSYDASELMALLPMRRPAAVDVLPGAGAGGWRVKPTPLARALNVLQLQTAKGETATGWPPSLPELIWAQSMGELKPATEVLAHATLNVSEDEALTSPLITRMHYGAGQIIYVATDETWRWRYGRGDFYFEQVWTQLIRMLGRGRVQQDTQRARLTVSHRRVELDQAIVVTLQIDDPLLIQRKLSRIGISIHRAGEEAPLQRLHLRHKPDAQDDKLMYETIWRPGHAGRLVLSVDEASLGDSEVTQTIEVVRPDDEMRYPAPDRGRLQQLAKRTGGELILPGGLADVLDRLPKHHKTRPDDMKEPLWDSTLAMLIMVLLLTGEWVGRKVIRLV